MEELPLGKLFAFAPSGIKLHDALAFNYRLGLFWENLHQKLSTF
jgi:hypothetical protein